MKNDVLVANSKRVVRVSELIDSGALVINDGYRVTNRELGSSGVPFVRGGDIGDGTINTAVADHVLPEFYERIQGKLSQPEDVAFITKGTVGRVGYLRAEQPQVVFAPQVCYWRVTDQAVIHPKFLFYLLQSHEFQASLHAVKTHGSMVADYVSLSDQHSFFLTLPPIGQQRAIAKLLGTLDGKIDSNLDIGKTLEAMARALFKSWFVDFDPVRAKREGGMPTGMDIETAKLFPSAFDESGAAPIPLGWRVTSLGAEANRCGGAIQTGPFGSQLHASDYVSEGIPVIMPKDIAGRRVVIDTIARIREQDAVRLLRHRVQLGDLVYSRRGDVERHALISTREVGWLCGTGCLLVRLGAQWPSPAFASFALDRPETRAWISQRAIGATMPNLNTGILSAVPFIVSSDDVLRAFARICDPLQELIVVKAAEIATLAEIRDTLLPKLISGELRIKDAETLASAAL